MEAGAEEDSDAALIDLTNDAEGSLEDQSASAHIQPTRRATRHAFHEDVSVEVDGVPAVLADLSLIGAQLLALTTLKPNRVINLALPHEGQLISCTGKIVWARLEPDATTGALRYRAGVYFMEVDEAAVEGFIAHHAGLAP